MCSMCGLDMVEQCKVTGGLMECVGVRGCIGMTLYDAVCCDILADVFQCFILCFMSCAPLLAFDLVFALAFDLALVPWCLCSDPMKASESAWERNWMVGGWAITPSVWIVRPPGWPDRMGRVRLGSVRARVRLCLS